MSEGQNFFLMSLSYFIELREGSVPYQYSSRATIGPPYERRFAGGPMTECFLWGLGPLPPLGFKGENMLILSLVLCRLRKRGMFARL